LPRKYAETVTFNTSPDVVMACVANVFVTRFHAEPERGPRGITAQTKRSAAGWGENITAIVDEVGPEGTIVTIYSESVNPLGFFERNNNKHNVQMLIAQVGRLVAAGGPPGAGRPAGPYASG
jgi:hypothetical protein